ncbi:imidazoleglycerol-phosphate dehydratase [Methanomicrobium sp. W14]|jgi:imidazoleglycerol phosphate dehydratase HisB|uniref:imidazoleglycerol-phosphate dehydratase HisB n=1 Tax=Methanomicrobium sp. W14 TaxID=2817839 RepID=UPI001AE4FED7|nr:imidazoleglycerol-phosphate dehydratase HisB [Methanomicrobium sp. W14]MBP2133202.1 imidazoleglycerol-phosphate dehydratase [Methanomicrobium sp. W14]
MRSFEVSRETKETFVSVFILLEGSGIVNSDTKIPFLDHMLNAMGRHGGFDLTVEARGDLEVDMHHTVEDVGIVLGQTIDGALGDKKGIERFYHTSVPMDEAIATATLDLGGRPYLVMNGEFSGGLPFPNSLVEHFFYSLCLNAKITAHLSFSGRDDHHMCEALFKAFGVCLSKASHVDPGKGIPSTKGSL